MGEDKQIQIKNKAAKDFKNAISKVDLSIKKFCKDCTFDIENLAVSEGRINDFIFNIFENEYLEEIAKSQGAILNLVKELDVYVFSCKNLIIFGKQYDQQNVGDKSEPVSMVVFTALSIEESI